jgi:mannose-6-phosphate isomerase-like protein (cupin superfamily)
MGDVKPKIWGTTETLIDHPHNSTHRIFVNPGGYCSWHFHAKKWNAFVVIRGTLTVVAEESSKENTVKFLAPGDIFYVRPGVNHRFINESKSQVEALEYYWPDGLDALDEDIIRFDIGGVRK